MKIIKLLILLLFSLSANAIHWSIPVDTTEKLLPGQAGLVKSFEAGDGTMWRLITPEYYDQNYAYFERFDPVSGILINQSTYKFKTPNDSLGYQAGIAASGFNSVVFFIGGYARVILPNLQQKENFFQPEPPFLFVPKFKYLDFEDRTEVLNPVTNEVLRVIPIGEKPRLPQAQALSESGSVIFYAELYEEKMRSTVVLSAHKKNDGGLLWRKKLATPSTNPIFNNNQYSGQKLQLSSAEGTITLIASTHRYQVEKSTLWIINENTGDVRWESSDSMIIGGVFRSSLSGITTSLGNSIIYKFSTQSYELRSGNGELIRQLPSFSYLLPNGDFLVLSSSGIEKSRELDGQVVWTVPRSNSNTIIPLCLRGNDVVFVEDRGQESLGGRFSLLDGTEVSTRVPVIQDAVIGYPTYVAPLVLRECKSGPTISRYYKSELSNIGLGFDDAGTELWRITLNNQPSNFQSTYSIGAGARLRWWLGDYGPVNSMFFISLISNVGVIQPRFWPFTSEIYEANSRHIKISVTDKNDNGFELRQFRSDTATNFIIARLDPENIREVIDLATSVESVSMETGKPNWKIRVVNNSANFAKSVRVLSDQHNTTYRCLPGPGAFCRDGDGNRILSAEVDLPANGGYVEFKVQKLEVGYVVPLYAIPGFDQLEATPENNIIYFNQFLFFDSFE